MGKKILYIFMALIIVFSAISLAGCNGGSLADYKVTKSVELQGYATAKRQHNYCETGWATICKAVTDGKQAIKDALNKSGVDIAVSDAKITINAVEREDANLEWTNDTAVYAFVKAGFESDILQDVESSFETLNFKKVYVVEKNVNTWIPLMLLFILDESGTSNQQEFIDLLCQDSRINHASKSRDLPFETVDTRHIDKMKDTIEVGETLTLEAKGSIDCYVQPFGFKGLLVKPMTNKTYTIADFPVDIKSMEARNKGWIYLELAKEGYFNLVKITDILSRLSTIEKVEQDKSEWGSVIPPIWQISDTCVAAFESTVGGGYPTAIIKGIKPGKVTVDFDGVSCEITVI